MASLFFKNAFFCVHKISKFRDFLINVLNKTIYQKISLDFLLFRCRLGCRIPEKKRFVPYLYATTSKR
tara:strand:+ start:2947 stop:3150 length:204 start_codon:yes stop_codon:yes gene_type:complete